jgi:Bacterial Peptidase A24 N-terminal domain
MTTSHHAVTGLFFAILGSCLGSFLNVCAYRIPRAMSVLHPRSHCPRCGAGILARDNVPVVGWLVLCGRCRACRCAIPPRYALVELAVGLLFALPYLFAAALAGGEPWERIGPGRLLGILLASWSVTCLCAFAILVGREFLRSFGVDRCWRRVGRQGDAKARHPSPLGREELAVELDDLVGASGIPQPVACDAAERFIGTNDVDDCPGASRRTGADSRGW